MKTKAGLMQHLLRDFESADIAQWERQVLNEFGLEKMKQLAQIQLSNEIVQFPYVDFTSHTENHLGSSYRNCTAYSGESWQGARYWLNMERIEGMSTDKLNQMALVALSGGAEGIIMAPQGDNHWEQLLEGISLSDCQLGVEAIFSDILDLAEYLESLKLQSGGFFVINDLQQHLVSKNPQLVELLTRGSGFRSLILEETDAASGTLSELSQLLSQGIYTINTLLEAGAPLADILDNIQVNLQIGDSFLWEICRLRCLRILFHQVAQQYGATDYPAGSLNIQATTGGSLNQQLLANTVQAMAAVMGGCNILTVVPHHEGFNTQDPWLRSIARNISHILKEECKLDKVADPVAGSYYLEDLTDKMLREVWSGLQKIESAGGYQHDPAGI